MRSRVPTALHAGCRCLWIYSSAARQVDQGLVVAAAGAIDNVLKVLDNIVIKTNRDAGLTWSCRNRRPPSGLAKVVSPFLLNGFSLVPGHSPPLHSELLIARRIS